MADFADIVEIIPSSAIDNVNRATKAVQDGIPAIAKYAEAARDAANALGDAKGITAFLSAQARADAAAAKLIKANLDLSKTATEAGKADLFAAKAAKERAAADAITSKEADRKIDRSNKATAAAAREAKGANSLQTAYGKLRAEYGLAEKQAKEFYLTLGEGDARTIAAIKNAKELSDKLGTIEAAVGQNQRNVGNYKSAYDGLGASLQGLLREVPSVQSAQQLFLSWSNQLPQFFDELSKASLKVKEFAANTAALNTQLEVQKALQAEAIKLSQATGNALADQVDSIVDNITATTEQAVAIKEQIAEQIAASATSIEAAEAAAVNTEAILLNAGANVDDAAAIGGQVRANGAAAVAATESTVAMNRLNVAVTENTAATAANSSVGKRLINTLFSMNTLLLGIIIVATTFGDKIVGVFTGASAASKKAEAANKKYKESIDNIESSSRVAAQQEIARLNILTTLAADNEQSTGNRARAIKELQETYPDYFGNLDKEIILQGKATAAINEATQALLNRAAAQAAEKKFAAASETVYDLTTAQTEALEDLTKAREARDKAGKTGDAESRGLDQFFAQTKVTELKKRFNDITAALKEAQKEQSKYLTDAQKSAALAGQTLFGNDPATPKERTAKDKKGFPELNLRINAEMDTNAQIIGITRNYLLERQKLYEGDLSAISASRSIDEQNERIALSARFKNGLISEEKYRKQLKDINDKYDLEELKALKNRIGTELFELGRMGYDTTALQKKYHDIEVALNKEKNDQIIEDNEKAAELSKKIDDKRAEAMKALYTLFKTVVSAQFETRFASLQNEEVQIDKNKDKEVRAIQASIMSQEERQKLLEKYNLQNISDEEKAAFFAEEKQARIAVAEAKAAAQREDIAAREKQLRRDQAKYERAIAIGEIIALTAQAVIKAFSQFGPVAGIPLAALSAGVGAIQLATVLATPLPAYAEGAGIDGKAKHKGGLARVGDNKSGLEYIIEPGRDPYAVKGDQIKDLRAGTTVIPSERLNAMAYGMLAPQLVRNIQTQKAANGNNESFDKWGARIERAVKGSKVNIQVDASMRAYIKQNWA